MKKISILIATIVIFIGGCVDPRIDSSTDEKFKKSIEMVKQSLSAGENKDFEEGIQAIINEELGNPLNTMLDPEGLKRSYMNRLDGKTARAIIAEGHQIKAKRKESEDKMPVGIAK